jgi:hypothetical protein
MTDEERARRRVVLHRKMLRDWSASDPVERTVWLSEFEYADWLRLLRRAEAAAAGSPERTAALNELRCLAELRWEFPDAVYGEPDEELPQERAVTPSETALSGRETALDDGPGTARAGRPQRRRALPDRSGRARLGIGSADQGGAGRKGCRFVTPRGGGEVLTDQLWDAQIRNVEWKSAWMWERCMASEAEMRRA